MTHPLIASERIGVATVDEQSPGIATLGYAAAPTYWRGCSGGLGKNTGNRGARVETNQ